MLSDAKVMHFLCIKIYDIFSGKIMITTAADIYLNNYLKKNSISARKSILKVREICLFLIFD